MAAADRTKVVEFVIDAMVVLPGIPVPATGIPTTRPSVVSALSAMSLLLSSVKILSPTSAVPDKAVLSSINCDSAVVIVVVPFLIQEIEPGPVLSIKI